MPKTPDEAHLHVVKGEEAPDGVHDLLIRKLESIAPVSDLERQGIRTLRGTIRKVRHGEDIVSEGDRPGTSFMLIEGFVCRYKILESGRRQILSFHIPGDVPDALTLYLKRMDHSLASIETSTIIQFPHQTLHDAFDQYPGLVSLFWRDTLIDAAIFREWVVNLGGREAYPRLAHLFCEIMTKMKVMGLAEGNRCTLRLTQGDIGDATGLSTVHVNRTLQRLRAEELIEFRGGSLDILDWDALSKVAGFDPAYLHLRKPLR